VGVAIVSWARWFEGCLVVAAVFGPTFSGARAVRRRLARGWPIEVCALADMVLMFSAVIVLGEALGTVHLFRAWALVVGGPAMGVALHLAASRLPAPDGTDADPIAPRSTRLGSRGEIGLAIAALIGLGAQSLNSAVDLARNGLYDFDSLHYHLTIAARFVTTGSTTGIPVLGQDASGYYPANAELLHAVGLSGYRVEVLSPVVNLAAIVFLLLGAAAIGALVNRVAAAVAVAAAVLTLPIFGTIAVGALSNDVFAMAAFLAFVALAAWCARTPQPHRFAVFLLPGFAAGLAMGTKLTVAAPLALVVLAVAAAQSSVRDAARVAGIVAAAAVVTGGYWLVRNIVAIHNPLPEVAIGVGPFRLPAPRFDQIDAASQSVAHYLTDRRVIRRFYLPGMNFAFGRAWPVLVALIALAAVVLIARGSKLWRLIGAAGVLAGLAYAVTPTTAGGAEGFPFLFRFNLRYAGPALVVLAVGALVSPLLSRFTAIWAGAFVAVEVVALTRGSTWADPSTRARVFAATVVAAACVYGLVYVARRAPRQLALGGVAVVAVVAIVAGGVTARRYVTRNRYAHPASARDQLLALGRHRSGVTAVDGLPLLASFYGPQLDGRVTLLAEVHARHEVVPPQTCARFRDELHDHHADLVVILRTTPGAALPSEGWAASTPGARLVLGNEAGAAYALPRDVTRAGCP
jgi:hypothetical protein